jgi:predicted Zn finger-like uncharacterized protein
MRLICPSCGAQYEVDAELVPAAGRDVQCSACGHVWFEEPGRSEAEEFAAAPATVAEAPPVAGRAPRRTVTPAIAEILREEAAREKAAREAEARAALERQEELPLPEPEAEAEPAPEVDEVAAAVEAMVAEEAAREEPVRRAEVPAATIRAADPPPVPVAPEVPVSRRDRLPDIEEINSTLSPGTMTQVAAATPAAGGGRGFRLGFGLVLLIAAALALVYVFAPRIVAAVPGVAPVMTPYVDAVDAGRLWLDLRLQDLLSAMGAAGEEG